MTDVRAQLAKENILKPEDDDDLRKRPSLFMNTTFNMTQSSAMNRTAGFQQFEDEAKDVVGPVQGFHHLKKESTTFGKSLGMRST